MLAVEREQKKTQNKNLSSAVAKIADRTGCQWPSSSSEVNVFLFISKGVCDFILVSNLTPLQGHPRLMIFM